MIACVIDRQNGVIIELLTRNLGHLQLSIDWPRDRRQIQSPDRPASNWRGGALGPIGSRDEAARTKEEVDPGQPAAASCGARLIKVRSTPHQRAEAVDQRGLGGLSRPARARSDRAKALVAMESAKCEARSARPRNMRQTNFGAPRPTAGRRSREEGWCQSRIGKKNRPTRAEQVVDSCAARTNPRRLAFTGHPTIETHPTRRPSNERASEFENGPPLLDRANARRRHLGRRVTLAGRGGRAKRFPLGTCKGYSRIIRGIWLRSMQGARRHDRLSRPVRVGRAPARAFDRSEHHIGAASPRRAT